MRKSQTGTFLPSIRSHRASMEGRPKMKSFFLQKVKKEVVKQASYEGMESSLITEEQHKLKNLLREFNDRSQSILADYISGPLKSKEGSPPKIPIESIRRVLDQEQAILQKIILQCQNQLKGLESRCQNLKYVTREEMEKQVQQVKQEIQQLKVLNRDAGREVTLNGLNICRGEKFDQVPDLEYQRAQLQAKRTQLSLSNEELTKEIEAVKGKAMAAEKEGTSLEEEYLSAVSQLAGSDQVQKLKQVAKEKRKQIDYFNGRNQQAAAALKQRYYTKLKQFDEFKTQSQRNADILGQREEDLGRSRKELIVLEHRLSALKQKVVTVQLLNRQ